MPEQWYTAYAERNQTLLELGYSSYKAYLASTLWNSIRQRVIERDRRSCWVCGFKAREVHHRLYSREVLSGQCLDYLVALCRDCHNKVEFSENLKLSLHDANNRLDALKAEITAKRTLGKPLQRALTSTEFLVKVPTEIPSVQSMRRPSKRQRRRERQRQDQAEYVKLRETHLAHKAEIVQPKVIKAEVQRDKYVPPINPRTKKEKRQWKSRRRYP